MGYYCQICACSRPNKAFSRRGRRTNICRQCMHRPAAEREAIKQKDEVFGYLRQSNISAKNIARLKELVASADTEVVELAEIVLAVALVKPHKRRRIKFLARNHRDLLQRLDDTGLIMAHW